MHDFLKLLDQIRREEGWSQDEAADKVGVSRATYSHWMNHSDKMVIRPAVVKRIKQFIAEYHQHNPTMGTSGVLPLREFLDNVLSSSKIMERYAENAALEFTHSDYIKMLEMQDRVARAVRLVHAAHSASIFQKLPMVAETPAVYTPKKKPAS